MNVNYIKNDFQFNLRTSALIFNKDKTKVLLFNVEGRSFYMLPGGRVEQLEESKLAIAREIKEEIGYENLDFELLAISEEFSSAKGYNNHQINIIYKTIYNENISEIKFKGLEADWINFEWVDISKLENIDLFPRAIKKVIFSNKVSHIVDNLL